MYTLRQANVSDNVNKSSLSTVPMETHLHWWTATVTTILAVVCSMILLLFLLTLLLNYLPRVHKWLSSPLSAVQRTYRSTCSTVAAAYRTHRTSADSSSVVLEAPSRKPSEPDDGNAVSHPSQPQPQQHPRIRPSRPCSLPCLPEEEKLYFHGHGGANTTTTGAAVPNSRSLPFQGLNTGDADLGQSVELISQLNEARGRPQKLNVVLHSDGSEASNSSSSASGALNDREGAVLHGPGDLHRHRSSSEVVLRHRRDLHGHPSKRLSEPLHHRHHAFLDEDRIESLDQWSSRHDASFAETVTDCDVEESYRRLPAATATSASMALPLVLDDETFPPWPVDPESILDITDLSSTFGESESVSAMSSVTISSHTQKNGGSLVDLGLAYSSTACKLAVRIVELRNLQPPRNSPVQLRLLLLPDRKQRYRCKIRYVLNTGVQLMETVIFNRIEPDELSSMGLRFRLYTSERLRRERLLGEAFLGLASLALDLQREQQLVLPLESKHGLKKSLAALGRSTSSTSGCSSKGDLSPTASSAPADWEAAEMIPPRNGLPELLLGLTYNGTTGRLSVEVLRAAGVRSPTSSRAPDVCIKLLLLTHTGQELGRAKTSVKKNNNSPTFLETFMFQVTLFQLAEVTLLLSVLNKRSLKRRELLGWISLGFDSSAEQQNVHWQEMREAAGEQICHWHALLPP